ncbi:MAG: NAD-dependent epimerase/dehydratase family protein [Candidatus Cloacimonetes bacterium]|nr:NAD-dependent epimerase/dehydratase family protein [Candidatus Cloacimonadota bacterium]
MKNALIGDTGFVGSSLIKQTKFDFLYRSTNIDEIRDHNFDSIVCAGASAQKWIANREPNKDLKNIESLISNLKNVNCKQFILISTVDVFKFPIEVDENSIVDEDNLNPYGLHRRLLEKFVENHFENYLILRLPGLVGPGLRKNVIFDFLNNNNIELIDRRDIYQFYPMVNLWRDIQIALKNNLKLLHLSAEPITVANVASAGFGFEFRQIPKLNPVRYDFRSRYAELFYGLKYYQYSKNDTLLAIRHYAQSEPLTKK